MIRDKLVFSRRDDTSKFKLYDVGAVLTLRKTTEILLIRELTIKELQALKQLLWTLLPTNRNLDYTEIQYIQMWSLVHRKMRLLQPEASSWQEKLPRNDNELQKMQQSGTLCHCLQRFPGCPWGSPGWPSGRRGLSCLRSARQTYVVNGPGLACQAEGWISGTNLVYRQQVDLQDSTTSWLLTLWTWRKVSCDWCAPGVVVPKPKSDVRICIDLTKLNMGVKRETYAMPTVWGDP